MPAIENNTTDNIFISFWLYKSKEYRSLRNVIFFMVKICSVFKSNEKKSILIIIYNNKYNKAAINPFKEQQATPKKIKPTWLIEVYAIKRFILVCFKAPNVPINKEPHAANNKRGWRLISVKFKTTYSNLKKNKNKPAFITIAKKAVIGVQIPSYTSATHQWQGNTDNLKKKPNNIKHNMIFNSKKST